MQRGRALAALAVLSLSAGCSKKEEKEAEAVVPVQTAEVRRGPIRRIVSADGALYPRDQAAITPKISAPVRNFYVNRGDHVRQGQLLAVLENRDLAAAAVEGKAQYEQAQAVYKTTTARIASGGSNEIGTGRPGGTAGARRRARSSMRAARSSSAKGRSRSDWSKRRTWPTCRRSRRTITPRNISPRCAA